MDNILIISPHLDDAVFSCGQLMAHPEFSSMVVTIFAGVPEASKVVTAFDQKVGFDSAQQAVYSRREEDLEAMSILGADAIHLNYPDGQYGQERVEIQIRDTLNDIIRKEEPDRVLVPYGIRHPDHLIAARICRYLEVEKEKILVYEELPYRVDSPEEVKIREDMEWIGMPKGDMAKKITAMWAYKSQFPGMDLYSLCVPERFWRLK